MTTTESYKNDSSSVFKSIRWLSVTPEHDDWPFVFWLLVGLQVLNLLAFVFLLLLFKASHRRGRWLHGTNCRGTFSLTALEAAASGMALLNLHLSYHQQHSDSMWSELLTTTLAQARSFWLGLAVAASLLAVDARCTATLEAHSSEQRQPSRCSCMSSTFQVPAILATLLLSGLLAAPPHSNLFSITIGLLLAPPCGTTGSHRPYLVQRERVVGAIEVVKRRNSLVTACGVE